MKYIIEKEKSNTGLVFSITPDADVYYYNLELHSAINQTLIKLEKYDLLEDEIVEEHYLSLENLKFSKKIGKRLKNVILRLIEKYSTISVE
ncbi:hypothetical protein WA1_24000 [Scytonema hofmannii PCC 7110]|uniref:Uncharacterized protein n=1 Tax=Scytonema hofmannii PCC 7110 TaxID=128403 RepID=A0A139X7M9_9CYAN|nr:hypothetical protein [Scytonema hofmannii]KYC40707.1 hypothetical protein WA1_24000 [Scytonema hofmannii PCC 7110]